MSFTAYLVQPFQNTHENAFFRKVVRDLKRVYENDENKNVLIGNLSCGGHLLDAIFFSSGKIIIIDFKDYGGRLEFSENNPWKIYRNNDFTFVAGGGGIRNPYQQVNAYRFSLMNVLTTKQENILSPNHIDIRWDHINCMVLFHQDIQMNNETLPDRIKRFFFISDQNNYLNSLRDRFSNNLLLNNNEIENILRELDVRPENRFDENAQQQVVIGGNNADRGNRLDFVKRHTKDVVGLNNEQKILEYYRTILTLERFKESRGTDLYNYTLTLDPMLGYFVLNLTSNQNFYPEYLKNGQQQFPQNIFVGLNVISDNETIPLFNNIILRSDIEDPGNVNLKFSDFNIYSKILEEKGLSEDIIDDIITSMNECDSFQDKIELVRNRLEWDIQLSNQISVGLSNESAYSAQLLSELKSIIRFNEGQGHPLFNSFLRNERVNERATDFNFDPLILITESNFAQRKSIRLAFSQPLTVITGPPGTGKTQVILNIIANAIANNQTILFASKNNKAVDNVRFKFQRVLTEGDYVLRFGTKSEVRDKTKPAIERFINLIQQKQIVNHQDESNKAKHQYETLNTNAIQISNKLILIPQLEKNIKELKEQIVKVSGNHDKWIKSFDSAIKELLFDKKIMLNVSKNDLSFYINKFKNYNRHSLTRFFFNLFLKNKYYKIFRDLHNGQQTELQKYLERNIIILKPSEKPLSSYLDYSEYLFSLKEKSDEVERQNNEYIASVSSLNAKLKDNEEKYGELKSKEAQLQRELKKTLDQIPSAAKNYLNLIINQKLYEANTGHLRQYADYIPDNIPWHQQEIPQFIYSTKNFLNNFSAVIVTNLSVKNGFPLSDQMFDMVVVDEASQCDVASALPLIFRAKKLVVIGDPLQLTHITNVERYEEEYVLQQFNLPVANFNYVDNSLYKFSEGIGLRSNFESIFLNEHFRSHPDIISFSKEYFYLPRLGQELTIKTDPNLLRFEPLGITWKNVTGQMHRYRNENISEVEACISTIQNIYNIYPDASIGITTPYRHQAEVIRNHLPQNLRELIIADTVHKFQGDERDIMILSLVLCNGTPLKKANWINYKVPYLINVAITRARSSLFIIGDFIYCRGLIQRGPTPLSQLANYVHSLNRVENL